MQFDAEGITPGRQDPSLSISIFSLSALFPLLVLKCECPENICQCVRFLHILDIFCPYLWKLMIHALAYLSWYVYMWIGVDM